MGYASADIAERFQWTFPIVLAPANPGIFYVGSQHLWKSTNEGQSWTKISPDLTRHDPKTMGASGGPITKDNTGVETYATIFSIAPSPKDENVIWTGSDDGYVQVTRDGGTSWKNVTPKGLGDFARISLIEASPFRPGTAYVAANRYQQDDFKPYVFRTDDYGADLDADRRTASRPSDFARAIREDIKRGEAAVSRDRARRLRFVRRRRELAVAAAEPARHAGARHRGGAARPRHRHARARVLHHGQHRAAAAGRPPDDDATSISTSRRTRCAVSIDPSPSTTT